MSDLALKSTVFLVKTQLTPSAVIEIPLDNFNNVTILMSFIANGYVFKLDCSEGIVLAIDCAFVQQNRAPTIKY